MFRSVPLAIWLNLLFFISLFLQNFNLLRVNIETQPLLVFVFSLLFFLNKKAWYVFRKEDMLIFLLFLIIFVRFLFDLAISDYKTNIFAYVGYLIGPAVFFFMEKGFSYNKKIALFIKIYIFLSCVIALAYVLSFGPIMSIYKYASDFLFLRHYGFDSSSVRGLSFLFAEPSYAAVGFGILLVSIRFCYFNHLLSKKELIFYSLALVFCLLVTKTLMSILLIAILFISKSAFKFLIRFFIVLIPLVYFLFFPFVNLLSVYIPRVAQLENALLSINSNISLLDFLVAFSIAEPSASTRFIANFIGFIGMYEYPFGVGAGNISKFWLDIVKEYNMNFLYQHYGFISLLKHGGKLKAQTYIFNASFDFGIFFFFVFLSFIFLEIMHLYKKKRCLYGYDPSVGMVFFILVLVFFQGQISNCFLWFLLLIIKDFHVSRKYKC